jgi:hypothetical protein
MLRHPAMVHGWPTSADFARQARSQLTICGETSWNSSIIRCASGRNKGRATAAGFPVVLAEQGEHAVVGHHRR